MQADILFKNAEIFDPDTLEIKRGELAVTGTVISGKGEKLDCQAKKEIDLKGNITGKVYDLETEEEYTNIYVITQTGAFVSQVRTAYEQILIDIRNHCFKKNYFMFPQTNRITKWIETTYHDEPEFLWKKYPGYGIFRNQKNGKWYGAIMNIDFSKLDSKKTGEVEIIDLKLEEEMAFIPHII